MTIFHFPYKYYVTIQEPLEAINLLGNLTTGDDKEPVDAGTAVYLLGSILNRLNSTDGDLLEEFSQVINKLVYRTDVSAMIYSHRTSLKSAVP